METWPKVLPNPSTYSIQPSDEVSRSDFEQGASRSRRRFTTSITTIPVTFVMSGCQFQIFRSWYKHKINGGNDSFLINIKFGTAVTLTEAKFSKKWSAVAIKGGHSFTVSAELELDNDYIIDEATLDTVLSL